MKTKVVALLAIFVFSVLPGRAEIQLRGLVVADGFVRFSLYSSEDQTAKWVAVGQNFAGYAVAEYRPDRDVLILKKNNELIELRMAAPKIASTGAIAPARPPTDEPIHAVLERLLKNPIRDFPGRERPLEMMKPRISP